MKSRKSRKSKVSCAAMKEALQNPLILNQIFNNLSTTCLLSSCSLVSKFWLKQASKFIQNYRQCIVVQSRGKLVCDFLVEFDRLVGKMACKKDKRTIPFNGLELQVYARPNFCPIKKIGSDSCYENLRNHFNLKYLHMETVDGSRACHIHHPLLALLRQKGSQLKTLKPTLSLNFLIQLCKEGQDLSQLFLALEVLDMSDLKINERYSREDEKESLNKLLIACPKLKQLIAKDICQIKLFPKEKLKSGLELQEKFKFRMARHEDLDFLNVISAPRTSKIQNLSIYVPPFEGQTENDFSPEEKPVDWKLRQSFDIACKRMLKTCHSNLEEISIHGVFPLAQLSRLPPLSKVSKFKVVNRYDGEGDKLWNSVKALKYDRVMPELKSVEISIKVCSEDADEDFQVAWPEEVCNDPVQSSTTARKLSLEVQGIQLNLRPLMMAFPKVTTLHLKMLRTWETQRDFAPLADIWKYIPNLEELKITVEDGQVHRIYDADFCGINSEEVRFLCGQTNNYLSRVHIVPLRRSIVTMTKLRKLEFQFENEVAADSKWADQIRLVTKVTKIVAFDRMPQLETPIPRYFESYKYDDDEDEEEEDEDEEEDEEEEEEDKEEDKEEQEEESEDDDNEYYYF